jgi:hypothetical protein
LVTSHFEATIGFNSYFGNIFYEAIRILLWACCLEAFILYLLEGVNNKNDIHEDNTTTEVNRASLKLLATEGKIDLSIFPLPRPLLRITSACYPCA